MTTVAEPGGFRTQRLTLSGGERTWTVLGRDHRVVEPAEEYLEYLRVQRSSPNTVKSYARALALWWQYLEAFGLSWGAVTLEDFGGFLSWLRTGLGPTVVTIEPVEARFDESTVAVRLRAVLSLYTYHQLNVVDVARDLSRIVHGRGGGYKPLLEHVLYFQHLHPLWLRRAAQWYLKVSLETGDLTWTTARARRSGLQVFGDWISGLDPVPPPWLRADPAGVRLFMLDFLGHVRAQKARSGPNRGKPLSALRVNDIVTDVEKFYAFMVDEQEVAARALSEPERMGLGPYHAILWRRGEKGRPKVQPERWEVIDDTAFSQILANLHVLGAPVEQGGFDDEQLMRIMMLQVRLGRRISEIRMLDREPLSVLSRLDRPSEADAADGAFVAKLRYQQTKIEEAPDTILVDAEVVAIVRAQHEWADAHLRPRWAPGVEPKYLFLAHKMNRHADKPYPVERIHQKLSELAKLLDVRDGAGRLVDFNRTHRFRHTKATSLLNAGVPMHVIQRYFGHLTPAMLMTYAQTLAETHEREFLRYRKITADGRELEVDPRDLYDMLELDKRTDRILPNGWCLLPPRQSCDKGNACLTCEKFTTDTTFQPELTAQRHRTEVLISERQIAFAARTGAPMGEDNVWLAGRRQELGALERILTKLDQAHVDGAAPKAVRGAGVAARTDATINNERKTAAAKARADQGLREMIRRGQPITFRGLAQSANVSVDFLYRCAEIRERIEQLRAQQQSKLSQPTSQRHDDSPSSAVRTLTAQLSLLRQRHRDEVLSLRQALETAHSENLELRRRLGSRSFERYQD